MAPIKFEEQLKDKLEKRTLSPSSEGWSKLSERLDADEKNSKNPIFWWLSIAAGILIMIAISAQFFGTNESEEVMPQVAEEKVLDEQIDEQIEVKESKLNDTKSIELAHEDSVDEKKENSTTIKKPQIIDYIKATQKESKSETLLAERSDSETRKSNTQQEGEVLNKEAQDLLNEATLKNAVTDALKEIKSETASVSDREIDSLLKIASKELFKDKIQKETSKTVDANALLMSVEDDMGQSFRSKVFEALTESYKTVKTAVAERNN